MLTKSECIEIARNECVAMFGKGFVEAHRGGFCSTRYIDEESGLFEYSLLYDSEDDYDEQPLTKIGGDREFKYYASVVVDMRTGDVRKDPDERKTRLPS